MTECLNYIHAESFIQRFTQINERVLLFQHIHNNLHSLNTRHVDHTEFAE